jgi:hypothetical protein
MKLFNVKKIFSYSQRQWRLGEELVTVGGGNTY